jgi:hypothetical protein
MKNYCYLFALILLLTNSLFSQELPPFKVVDRGISNATAAQQSDMRQAILIFEQVMNNRKFQKELFNLKRIYDPTEVISNNQKDTKYKIAEDDCNYRFTTEQIVRSLYTGKEFFDRADNDNTADIYWNIMKKKCRGDDCVRGKTPHKPLYDSERDNQRINTFSWFINDIVDADQHFSELVGHLAHEWSHKFNFLDTGDEFDEDDKKFDMFSYVFGRIVEKYAEEICGAKPHCR